MTFNQFAESIVNDPEYRDSLLKRARAGNLSPEVEALLIETASGLIPLSADHADLTSPAQSRTLALVEPLAFLSREAAAE